MSPRQLWKGYLHVAQGLYFAHVTDRLFKLLFIAGVIVIFMVIFVLLTILIVLFAIAGTRQRVSAVRDVSQGLRGHLGSLVPFSLSLMAQLMSVLVRKYPKKIVFKIYCNINIRTSKDC